MQFDKMSGIEYINLLIKGKVKKPSVFDSMGIKLVQATNGVVLVQCTSNEKFLNPMGTVHGGYTSTVLDTAAGFAVHSVLDSGERYATVDLNTKMFRPLPKNTKLSCEGKIINRSHSLGVSEAHLFDGEDKLYAHATCTCMITKT